VCELQARGLPAAIVAAQFHNSLAAVAAEVCERIGSAHDLDTVALSGGVFGNARLTTTVRALLEARGFTVLTHRQVPANDGGISLGQAAVAAARS
jgi:hydrogenase maturation protein HypF